MDENPVYHAFVFFYFGVTKFADCRSSSTFGYAIGHLTMISFRHGKHGTTLLSSSMHRDIIFP